MDKEDVVYYVYNRILLSHKKNEIMLFAATWMDLKIIILSEGSQRKTNMYHLYVESKKMIQMNLFKKQTHRHRKQTYGYQRGKVWRRDKLEVWD